MRSRLQRIKSTSIHFQNVANAESELRTRIQQLIEINARLKIDLSVWRFAFCVVAAAWLLVGIFYFITGD